MCGIVGIIGHEFKVEDLIEGLKSSNIEDTILPVLL